MILFSKTASTTKLKKCYYQDQGDGYCHDSNNNADCDFDGGDCCLNLIINQFCNECWCYADNTSYDSGKNHRSKLFQMELVNFGLSDSLSICHFSMTVKKYSNLQHDFLS